jgi:uncharacterized protein (DUF486 family)
MRTLYTILLLIVSNVFMTMAWYGHLKFKEWRWFEGRGLWVIILVSWGIALAEYCFQVPANRIGSREYGGPHTLMQLKVMQEAITLVVFVLFSTLLFKNEPLKTNHFIGLGFLLLAVYFVFKDR